MQNMHAYIFHRRVFHERKIMVNPWYSTRFSECMRCIIPSRILKACILVVESLNF